MEVCSLQQVGLWWISVLSKVANREVCARDGGESLQTHATTTSRHHQLFVFKLWLIFFFCLIFSYSTTFW
ncbi:hypothetical protein LINPERPRIM_LOCUS28065, partial [Linum perenne]